MYQYIFYNVLFISYIISRKTNRTSYAKIYELYIKLLTFKIKIQKNTDCVYFPICVCRSKTFEQVIDTIFHSFFMNEFEHQAHDYQRCLKGAITFALIFFQKKFVCDYHTFARIKVLNLCSVLVLHLRLYFHSSSLAS